MSRGAGWAAAAIGLMLTATGCGATPAPRSTAYTFDTETSAVQVDTPQLERLKAQTGIQPCPNTRSSSAPVPGGLPEATLPCLGGGASVDLAALRGPLLLNFWAQYCGPCRDESPILQRFASSVGDSVQVIGVDFYDPLPARAIDFARQLGLTYPQIADPDAAMKAPLRIFGLPITLFIDRFGRISYTQVGAITSQRQLDQLVAEHLGVADSTGSSR